MTSPELTTAHCEVIHIHATMIEEKRFDRDNAIRQAALDGVRVADIADAADMTRARVYQILREPLLPTVAYPPTRKGEK